MRTATERMSGKVKFKADTGPTFTLTGAINGTLRPEVQEPTGIIATVHKTADLLLRCRDAKAEVVNAKAAQEFLDSCLDAACGAIREGSVGEPPLPSDDAPQYELQFDDRDQTGLRFMNLKDRDALGEALDHGPDRHKRRHHDAVGPYRLKFGN